MRRRTYLGVLASSIALAGCMGDGGDGGTTPTPTAEPTATPTPEPTPTVTETPTATPTPSEPVIERANMIHSTGPDDWIANNAIEAAGKGASVKFGFEYGLPAEQSRPEPRIDAKVRDEAGTVVASQEISAEIDASDTDYVETSGWIGVDMANQPLGTYTAEITIFDRFNRVASEPAAIEFDIVSPLEPPEVRLRSHGPETVSIGESFYLATTFENLSSRDSSIVDNLGYRQPDWNSTQRITQVSYEVPANGIARHRLGSLSFDEPTTLIFELSRMDVTWEIEVV